MLIKQLGLTWGQESMFTGQLTTDRENVFLQENGWTDSLKNMPNIIQTMNPNS